MWRSWKLWFSFVQTSFLVWIMFKQRLVGCCFLSAAVSSVQPQDEERKMKVRHLIDVLINLLTMQLFVIPKGRLWLHDNNVGVNRSSSSNSSRGEAEPHTEQKPFVMLGSNSEVNNEKVTLACWVSKGYTVFYMKCIKSSLATLLLLNINTLQSYVNILHCLCWDVEVIKGTSALLHA